MPKKNLDVQETIIIFTTVSFFILLITLSLSSWKQHKRLNQLENDVSCLLHKDLPAPGVIENSRYKILPKNIVRKNK